MLTLCTVKSQWSLEVEWHRRGNNILYLGHLESFFFLKMHIGWNPNKRRMDGVSDLNQTAGKWLESGLLRLLAVKAGHVACWATTQSTWRKGGSQTSLSFTPHLPPSVCFYIGSLVVYFLWSGGLCEAAVHRECVPSSLFFYFILLFPESQGLRLLLRMWLSVVGTQLASRRLKE